MAPRPRAGARVHRVRFRGAARGAASQSRTVTAIPVTNQHRTDDSRLRARPLLPDVLLIALFLGAISAPLLAWAKDGIPPYRRMLEERMSTQLPELPANLAELSNFPTQFQGWFDDSLGLRVELLSARSRMHLGLFGTSPTTAAYLGPNAWVSLSGAREFDTHRGANPFSSFELDAWAGAIDARRKWCNARGIQYVFALAPFKTNVYPEMHPLAAERLGPTRFDQLAARFAEDSAFLDLRPAVMRAKLEDGENDHAYFPLGSHWTDRGSTAGARDLFERIRSLPGFADWRPIADEEMIWDPAGCEGDSWAGRLYLDGILRQNEHYLSGVRGDEPVNVTPKDAWYGKKIWELPNAASPSVLFFHDSFGVSMEPFFTHRASRCVCMWRPFEPELVTSESPRLVVELFVEHVLDRPPLENLPEQTALTAALFDSSRVRLFKLDAARDESELGHRGGIDVTREGSALRLVWTSPVGLAQLPADVLPTGKHVVVRLDVRVDVASELSFFYLSPDNDQYRRQQSLTRALVAGSNRIYLDLGQPGIRGPLVFRSPLPLVLPNPAANSMVLVDCEARVVR